MPDKNDIKIGLKVTGGDKSAAEVDKVTDAQQDLNEEVEKAPPTLKEHAREVKRSIKVEDEKTAATKRHTSALAQNVSRMKAVGLASAAAWTALQFGKRVLEDITRSLGINADAHTAAADKAADAAIAAIDHQINIMLQRLANVVRVDQRQVVTGHNQAHAHQGLTQIGKQRHGNFIFRYSQAHCFSFGMQKPARHL